MCRTSASASPSASNVRSSETLTSEAVDAPSTRGAIEPSMLASPTNGASQFPRIPRECFQSAQVLVHHLRAYPTLLPRLRATYAAAWRVTRPAVKLFLAYNVFADEEQREWRHQELRGARLRAGQAKHGDQHQVTTDVEERQESLVAQDALLSLAQEASLLRAQKLCAQEELDELLDAMPLVTLDDHRAKVERRRPLDAAAFVNIENLDIRLDQLEHEISNGYAYFRDPHTSNNSQLISALAQRSTREAQLMKRVQDEREDARLAMLESEEENLSRLQELVNRLSAAPAGQQPSTLKSDKRSLTQLSRRELEAMLAQARDSEAGSDCSGCATGNAQASGFVGPA